jgi:hypothetical protein
MALLASDRRVLAGEWELCLAVIERRARPLRGGMADIAGGRETGGLVIGIGRGVVVVDVAGGAVLRRAGEAIVGVALRTGDGGVFARQRELSSRVVVELRARPLYGRVTGVAGGGETRRFVVRIRCGVVVVEMAGGAVLRRAGEPVVDVALRASDGRVLTRQRELGGRFVIELRALPLRRRVARFTGSREPGRLVVRIRGAVVSSEVTRRTLRRQSRVLTVDVALLAGERRMLAGERELGGRVVVELRALPLRRGMAHLAGGGKGGRLVVRIRRAVVSSEVTGRTLRR